MKILHISDIHYHAGAKDLALASIDTVIEKGRSEGVDLFVLSGDLFDRGVQNSETGGLPALYERVVEMLNIAPVVAVEGTKTHDVPGCYEVFTDLKAEHKFTVLSPQLKYFLLRDGEVCGYPHNVLGAFPNTDMLILGCPEPTKEWLLAGSNGQGIQETNEAIKNGMRELFLGLGAIRKEYPDIPCLLVYHGSVAGATLQNSQILPPGGIEIGRDDLALVGADYYALGHIHLAQQIGDLSAYYAGSAYPVNWGETDQKSFNLVEFGGEKTTDGEQYEYSFEKIPYPHPPRKKIVTTWEYADDELDEEIDGFQVWQEYRVTKEEAGEVDPEKILGNMLKWGALPGSRVTTTVIPTETVRAGEIQAAQKLKDKVKVWAENSEKAVSESTLEKADTLEAEARREGIVIEGLHIRIRKLRLRGSIGIMKGQGREEIELDLDTYDPGLIALVGPNGAGKSTLIENMHPYNQLLTRSGKLQDHFCLRDSFRDLYFEDTRTGDQYRSYIMIDGKNASGKAECFLTKNGEPLSDGKVKNYEEKITELFGSLSMFVQSAFVAQKQKYDVTSATPGEKKAIFRELSGLDYLQTYAEMSKQKTKEYDNDISKYSGQIETLDNLIQEIPAVEQQRHDLANAVAEIDLKMKEAERAGKEKKTVVRELQEKVQKNNELLSKIDDLALQKSDAEKELVEINDKKGAYRDALQKQDQAEEEVTRYEKLKAEESNQLEEQGRVFEQREELQSQYRDACKAVDDERQKYVEEKEALDKAYNRLSQQAVSLGQKIEYLIEKTEKPIDETCPTCGQTLPKETREQLQHERHMTMIELEETQQEKADTDVEVNKLEEELQGVQQKIASLAYPDEPKLPSFDKACLEVIRAELGKINIANARHIREKAHEAEVRLEEIEQRAGTLTAQIDTINEQIEALQERTDDSLQERYEKEEQELEEAREEYQRLSNDRASKDAELRSVDGQLEQLQQQKQELEDVQKKLDSARAEMQEWQVLQQACGPDGIQALELDALAPNITEVANRLLTAAYGAQFQIEIRTTRIAGKGSKTKQVEDFQIYVLDDQGNEQSIDTLSGGESVWIKKALYDAFGIIRAKNTGTKFLTVFQDEADGALDPEAREKYFRMLEAAHHESKRHHTIVITHSSEIQEMIAQRIELQQLGAEKEEAFA